MKQPLLNIDLFTQIESDFETKQYKVLAALKKVSEDFQHNRIYPHLGHLASLHEMLTDLSKRLKDLRDKFPKRIKKIDFLNQEIEHEVIFVSGSDVSEIEELIDWALPLIKEKIEVGKTIYQFVNDEIKLEEVGIVPSYTDEGYFFVPDNEESRLLLFQYEVSIFQSSKDNYRSLKTALMKALGKGSIHFSPNSLKLDLIHENRKLPNPATYSFVTDLEFPFRETIFPVVKRKLLKQLYN